jgi:ribonucleoside-diphosphate reductase alpha chain
MSLQYGVPLEVYVSKFSHTRFEPMGHTKNPDIRIAKSIVDYIFRWLGITFIPGYREANRGTTPEDAATAPPAKSADDDRAPAAPATKSSSAPLAASQDSSTAIDKPAKSPPRSAPRQTITNAAQLQRAGVAMKVDLNGAAHATPSSEQFASFQLDAPSCDNCGAITVRNGNCYLCYNCGNSMGCS